LFSFEVFDRAVLKQGHVKRYAVTLAFRGLAVKTLPGASRSFNPALGPYWFHV